MPTKTKPKGKAKSAATGRKRTLIYVLQQPGPGKLWYWLTLGDGDIYTRFGTQREQLYAAIDYAKSNQPSTVYCQRKDGRFRLVNSYPVVRNAKPKAK